MYWGDWRERNELFCAAAQALLPATTKPGPIRHLSYHGPPLGPVKLKSKPTESNLRPRRFISQAIKFIVDAHSLPGFLKLLRKIVNMKDM